MLVFAAFQLMFAIITPALISGAIADRAKFLAWGIFVALWVTLVYFPVAHWVFDFGGTDVDRRRLARGARRRGLRRRHARCTSTPVPPAWPCASCSASASAGSKDPMRPHNLPFVLLGAGLLWFGWFGFNAGSALAANGTGRRWRS